MKKLSLSFLFVAFISSLYAQQAQVKIKFIGATENKVFVQLPVDGTTFYPARTEKAFGKDSVLLLDFDAGKIANVFISSNKKKFRFLIEPGKTDITLNFNKKWEEATTYIGANAEGQTALIKINTTFYQSRANRYYKLDSTAAGVVKLIAADEQKELQPFDELLKQHKISKDFYVMATTDIKCNYIAITAAIPIQIYFDSQRPNTKVVFKQEFKELWKKVYDEHPFNNLESLNAAEYYDHASYYSNYYVGMFLPQQNGTWKKPDLADQNERLKIFYQGFERNFNGKNREFLMASYLFNEMLQKEYQPVLVELFNNFKSQYPKSNYSGPLQPIADEIVQYNINIKNNFKADQMLIANYDKVNSFADLAAKFKGKTVFVDMWATWCGPCKAEFEHKDGLEQFLKSKGVEMLYISMDKDNANQQWKDMIKYYGLSGSHIRTNTALQQDLMNIFWDGKGYSIPRYLILKDGKVVVKDALRPSDKEQLYKQIAQYL